ncbi:MAG: hypothetical protein ACXVAU_07415 [Mucilaginibacter sp.]
MEFTVLTFAKIQFRGKWKRVLPPTQLITSYTPLGGTAELLVFVESVAGGAYTYEFLITPKEVVWVSTQENIIQIPAICIKSAVGDTTTCRG